MAELECMEVGAVTLLVAPGLRREGFVHGFSTRRGGASAGPFESLNLGRRTGDGFDDPERVAENHRCFAAALGVPGLHFATCRQVHGRRVHEAAGGDAAEVEADAVVSVEPAHVPLVRCADCAPVLLACPRLGAVAAVHAGWRGVVAGVVEAALEALERRGVRAVDLRAAIGPCIGPRAFEVGPEVARAFESRGLGTAVVRPRPGSPCGRPAVDLSGAIIAILERRGVPSARIDRSSVCTVERGDLFFSYRRDGERSGRMAAAIAPRPR